MLAPSLFLVFVIAKAAMLSGYHVPLSPWAIPAYLWQDALGALLFAGIEKLAPRRLARALYWTLALYAAINIPVGRAVGTPLTLPMLRAARGALADSIAMYVTWPNAVLVGAVLAAAAILPRAPWPKRMLAALAVALVACGPAAQSRVDTRGGSRNAVAALIAPRLDADGSLSADWRRSPYPSSPGTDLTHLRGAARGRNVVLVSLESTAAQYLSVYGGQHELTPRLTALANDAIVFDSAYAVYPESIQGLFSVLCSVHPAFGSRPEEYEQIPCQALPAALREAGYKTALFHSGRFGYLGMESIIRNRGYDVLADAGDIGGNRESSFGVDEPAAVAAMLRWIDGLAPGERFFLNYLPIAGHHPYETPEAGPFSERGIEDRYRNALLYGDAWLGALIDGLKARGHDRDTLWVIYGDHGEAFGQHEGNYGHTFFLYDENVRVPFVIAAPGLIGGQVRASQVVSLVDTAPAILDLLGLPVPRNYQGSSVLDGRPRVALFFADYSLGLLGLRDGDYKYIHEPGSSRSQLFHLGLDPRERTDISKMHPERVERYRAAVRGWSGAQRRYIASVPR